MRKVLLATCVGSIAAFAAGGASANDELIKMAQNPKDWVMPTGDYANTRYSKLNQITAANAGKLQVAWTFSTGVLGTMPWPRLKICPGRPSAWSRMLRTRLRINSGSAKSVMGSRLPCTAQA